jgi:nucleoside-diphosphate-sugar epimerase
VDGTERILEWAHRAGATNFLLLSSGASKDRTTAYGKAKAVAERLLPSGASIARIYTLVGPGAPFQYAVGRFIYQALNDGRVLCDGGERVYRSYLHLEDAARWVLAVMDHRRRADVGGALPYTVNEVAQLVAAKFGVPCVHLPDDTKRGSYLPDLNEALSIGCNTTIPLGTALERIRDEARISRTHLESSQAA